MKKLFFLLLALNVLVFVASSRFGNVGEPLPVETSGNIRFLSPDELDSLVRVDARPTAAQGSGHTAQVLPHAGPVEVPAAPEETAPAEVPAAGDKLTGDDQPTATSRGPRVCFLVGPIADEAAASVIASGLNGSGDKATIREEEELAIKDYWVLVPSENRDEALEVINTIRASGDRDVFMITNGEERGKVSVGVFSQRKNAEVRSSQMAKLGITAIVIPRGSPKRRWWVDWESDAPSTARVETAMRLKEANQGLEIDSRPCDSPAL